MALDTNSKRTRVDPIFGWLRNHGGLSWPQTLLALADGITVRIDAGELKSVHFEKEVQVPASAMRLSWMIRNADRLAPLDGRRWRELYDRVINNSARQAIVDKLDGGDLKDIPPRLILEGSSNSDCLVECERALIWVEGKRHDWLSPSTTWDVARDQVARNLEAVWSLARARSKDYCLIICHEYPLKHHEQLLVDGYRAGTWSGGWPHLTPDVHQDFGARIGTLAWSEIANRWPLMRELPLLRDLA